MGSATSLETDTQRRILECARALFSEAGFAATSVREIALAAGVTKPMLYYYFGSKDALFEAVADDTAAQLMARYEAALARGRNAREQLTFLASACRSIAHERVDLIRFVARCFLIHHGPGCRSARDRERKIIGRVVQNAVAEGELDGEKSKAAHQIIRGSLLTYYIDALHCGATRSGADPEHLSEMLWRALASPERGSICD